MSSISDIAKRNTQMARQGWDANTSTDYKDRGTLHFNSEVLKLLEATGKNLHITQGRNLSENIRKDIGAAPAVERHTTLEEAKDLRDCIYKFCGIQKNMDGTYLMGSVYPTDEQHRILDFKARQEQGIRESSIDRSLGNFSKIIDDPKTIREQEQHRAFFNTVLKEIGTSKVLQDISARCPDVLDCGNSKDPAKLAEYKAYKNEVSRIFFEAAGKAEAAKDDVPPPPPPPPSPDSNNISTSSTSTVINEGDTITKKYSKKYYGDTINNFGPITINFPGGNPVQGPNNTPPPAKTNIFSGPAIRLDRPGLQGKAKDALGKLPKDVQVKLWGDSNPEDPILAFAKKNIAGFATMDSDVQKRVLNAIAADVMSIVGSSNPEGLNLTNLDPQILKTSMLGVAEKARVMKDYAVVQVVNQPPPAGQENSAALLPNMYATMLKQFPEGQRTAALCAAKLLEDTIKDLSSEADKDFIRKMFNNEKSAKAIQGDDVLDIIKNMQAGLWQAAKNEDDDELKQLEKKVAGELRMKYQFSVTEAQEVNLYIPQEGETSPNDVTSLIDTLPLPENTRTEIKNVLNEFQTEFSKVFTPEMEQNPLQILESANGNFDAATMQQLQQILAPVMPFANRLNQLLGSSLADPKVQQQFVQAAVSSLPTNMQEPLKQPLMQLFTQAAAIASQDPNSQASKTAIDENVRQNVAQITKSYADPEFLQKDNVSTQEHIANFISDVENQAQNEETLNALMTSDEPLKASNEEQGNTLKSTLEAIIEHTIPEKERGKQSIKDIFEPLDSTLKQTAIDILKKSPQNPHPELTEEAMQFACITDQGIQPDRTKLIHYCKQLHQEGELDQKKLNALTQTIGFLEGRTTRGSIPSGISIRKSIMNDPYFRKHKIEEEIQPQTLPQLLAKLPSKLRKEINKELTELEQSLGGEYSLASINKLFEDVDNFIQEEAKRNNETTKDAGERLHKAIQKMTLPVYKFVQRINELLPAAGSQVQMSSDKPKAKKPSEERKDQDIQQARAKLLEPIMARVENDAKRMQQLTNMFKEGIDSQKIYTNPSVQKFCQEHGAINVFDIQIMSPNAANNITNLQRIENSEYEGMPLYANFNTEPMQVVIVSDETTPRTFDALWGTYSGENLPKGKGSEPHEFIGNFLTSVKERTEVYDSLREGVAQANTNNSLSLSSVMRETSQYIGIANRGPLMVDEGAKRFSLAVRNIMHRAKSSEGQLSLNDTLNKLDPPALKDTAITIFKQDTDHNPHPEFTEKALEFAYAPTREALGQYCKTLGDEQADQLLETIAYLESGKENVSADAIKEGKEGILVAMLEQDKANPNPALTKEALDMFSDTNKFHNYSTTHSPEEIKQLRDTVNYIANYTNKSR